MTKMQKKINKNSLEYHHAQLVQASVANLFLRYYAWFGMEHVNIVSQILFCSLAFTKWLKTIGAFTLPATATERQTLISHCIFVLHLLISNVRTLRSRYKWSNVYCVRNENKKALQIFWAISQFKVFRMCMCVCVSHIYYIIRSDGLKCYFVCFLFSRFIRLTRSLDAN